MRKVKFFFGVAVLAGVLLVVSCDHKNYSPLGIAQEQILNLNKQNEALRSLLKKKLESHCDTMTVEQKLKWEELQNFILDLRQATERQLEVFREKANQKEAALLKEQNEADLEGFIVYQKQRNVAVEALDSKSLTAYAVAMFKRDSDPCKYYEEYNRAASLPKIKKFLASEEKLWKEKMNLEKTIRKKYEDKRSELESWKQEEIKKIEAAADEEVAARRKDLGL